MSKERKRKQDRNDRNPNSVMHPAQSIHSRESEIGLLGCMILNNEIIPSVICELEEDSFFMDSTRMIYSHILKVWDREKLVDLVMIKDSLGPGLDLIGGIDFLASVVETVPNPSSWSAYLRIVSRKSCQRKQADSAFSILDHLREDVPDNEIFALAEEIRKVSPAQGEKGLGEVLDEGISLLEDNRDQGMEMSIGYEELDKHIGGLRRKTTYTIGGKTSQGKTTVMSNIVVKALNDGKKVLISVLENPDQVPMRLASIDSGNPLSWFLKPEQVSESAFKQARESLNGLRRWEDRLMVVGATPLAMLKGMAEKFQPDIVVLDYLQKYASRYCDGSTGNKASEVGKAASDFSDIAIDCDCAGILLSQVSRKVEQMSGRRPQIEDLKESGDIENYSDVVLLLYWPAKDNRDEKLDPLLYEIEVAKNKMGPAQIIASLKINSDTLKISDWADREPVKEKEKPYDGRSNGTARTEDPDPVEQGGHEPDPLPLPGSPEADVFSGDIRVAG